MNPKVLLPIVFALIGILGLQSCSKPTIVDARDGQIYKTVTIKEQTWFAENARYDAAGSLVNPDFPSEEYGRLYTHVQALEVCPEGWHLPTDEEWNELEMSFGMEAKDTSVSLTWRGNQAKFMKATTGWKFLENGKDNRGFKILPAGVYAEGTYRGLFETAQFWTASKDNRSGYASDNVYWYRYFQGNSVGVHRWSDPRSTMKSCRCVQDR